MFGRKKPGDEVSAENRAQLVEAYRAVGREIDDIVRRCSQLLTGTSAPDVPHEYVLRLRQTLAREQDLCTIVEKRLSTLPTGSISLAELGDEMKAIHQANVAANELLLRAGTDAASNSLIGSLAKRSGQ